MQCNAPECNICQGVQTDRLDAEQAAKIGLVAGRYNLCYQHRVAARRRVEKVEPVGDDVAPAKGKTSIAFGPAKKHRRASKPW